MLKIYNIPFTKLSSIDEVHKKCKNTTVLTELIKDFNALPGARNERKVRAIPTAI